VAPLQCATLFNDDGFKTKDLRTNPTTVDDGTEEPSAANMGFRWYDLMAIQGGNRVPASSIRSVYVRPGCRLEVFENEGFTGRSESYSVDSYPLDRPGGQFELTEGANNMNVIGIKSLKCHCTGTFCYSSDSRTVTEKKSKKCNSPRICNSPGTVSGYLIFFGPFHVFCITFQSC